METSNGNRDMSFITQGCYKTELNTVTWTEKKYPKRVIPQPYYEYKFSNFKYVGNYNLCMKHRNYWCLILQILQIASIIPQGWQCKTWSWRNS
jgi:hypothetical protein